MAFPPPASAFPPELSHLCSRQSSSIFFTFDPSPLISDKQKAQSLIDSDMLLDLSMDEDISLRKDLYLCLRQLIYVTKLDNWK